MWSFLTLEIFRSNGDWRESKKITLTRYRWTDPLRTFSTQQISSLQFKQKVLISQEPSSKDFFHENLFKSKLFSHESFHRCWILRKKYQQNALQRCNGEIWIFAAPSRNIFNAIPSSIHIEIRDEKFDQCFHLGGVFMQRRTTISNKTIA